MTDSKKILISIGSPIVHQGNIDELLRIIKEFNNKTELLRIIKEFNNKTKKND